VLEPRMVLRFALIAAPLSALLAFATLSSTWTDAYARGFRAAGNKVFSQFWIWPQASVTFLDLRSPTLFADIDAVTPGTLPARFNPPKPEDIVQDTLLVLQNKEAFGAIGMVRTSSRPIGYWPTAAVISLLIATPMRWIRKLVGLLLGLMAVHAFIAFRLTILLLKTGFADPIKEFHLFGSSPFWQDLWRRLDEVFADNPTFPYVAGVFIWLLVTVGICGWSVWRSKPAAAEAEATLLSPGGERPGDG